MQVINVKFGHWGNPYNLPSCLHALVACLNVSLWEHWHVVAEEFLHFRLRLYQVAFGSKYGL